MSETRNWRLLRKITVVLVICCCNLPAQAKYGGGAGVSDHPYLIFDANHMNEIGLHEEDWGAHFKLVADIDLGCYTGTSFNIIGNGSTWFTGVFDGSGHTISNFTYTSTGIDRIGIFGLVGHWQDYGEIKNLLLVDPNVNAGTGVGVGSLVGLLDDGTITNCYVMGGSVSGGRSVGGLLGANNGTITNCYSMASVSGIEWVGGLAAYNSGTISNCCATGSVSGTDGVGGLVGINDHTITNCYAAAGVLGNNNVGGLVGGQGGYALTSNSYSTGVVTGTTVVGGLMGASYGRIYNCCARGSVSGDDSVGGLAGRSTQGNISRCYAAASVAGDSNAGGLMGFGNNASYTKCFWDSDINPDVNGIGSTTDPNVIGESTENMRTKSTFTSAGWDFVNVWWISEGKDYPRLSWDKYGGGRGKAYNPYLIYTSSQMNAIGEDSNDWDKHFKLCADLDLSGYTGDSFNMIGLLTPNQFDPFTGVFDGNGHTISNFTYTTSGSTQLGMGLFECVDGPDAEIRNLGLVDCNVNIEEGGLVGSLVGYLGLGTITGCYVDSGSIVAGSVDVGGLVGGIVDTGTVINCYAAGCISGDTRIGGLVGHHYEGIITNCYSTGCVDGNDCVGGLVGRNASVITNSYLDIDTSNEPNMCGCQDVGSTGCDPNYGKTTSQMMQKSTFVNWDFWNIWSICERMTYPRLQWQGPLIDFLCLDGADFIDYSFFASHWQEDNCGASNYCQGADLDRLGTVDVNDLAIFVDNWLPSYPPPFQAINPSPPDDANVDNLDADLSWTAGAGAISHDVYFGTSNPPPFIRNQFVTVFDPGMMDYLTTYYWRIDERNDGGKTTGVVWSFSTTEPPPPPI